MKPLSGKFRDSLEMEHNDACEILPLFSNLTALCEQCDQTNIGPHCITCSKALGVHDAASSECFRTNPTIIRCDPDGGTSLAEVAACVKAECSSTKLREESLLEERSASVKSEGSSIKLVEESSSRSEGECREF